MSSPTLSPVTVGPARVPFDGGGLYFKQVTIAVFIVGLYLHLSRLFFGLDAVTQHVLTPTVDGIFGLVMAYAAVSGWICRPWAQHPSRRHRVLLTVVLVYLSISVPIHLRSFFVQDIGDALGLLPPWYSVVFLVVVSAMVIFVGRLRITRPTAASKARA